MATTMYFDELIKDQGGRNQMHLEFGRSSFYPEDSLYLKIDDRSIIVDRKTAKRIVDAMESVGAYLSLDKF